MGGIVNSNSKKSLIAAGCVVGLALLGVTAMAVTGGTKQKEPEITETGEYESSEANAGGNYVVEEDNRDILTNSKGIKVGLLENAGGTEQMTEEELQAYMDSVNSGNSNYATMIDSSLSTMEENITNKITSDMQKEINSINKSIEGAKGINGKDGTPGRPGATGATGPVGPAGKTGATGATGKTGATGPAGPTGKTGATGMAGKDGINGTNGKDGKDGVNGVDGQDGEDGNSVFIKYASTKTGTGMKDTPDASTKYMGTYVGKTASTNPSDYQWAPYQSAHISYNEGTNTLTILQ